VLTIFLGIPLAVYFSNATYDCRDALDELDAAEEALDNCPEVDVMETTTTPGSDDGTTTTPGDDGIDLGDLGDIDLGDIDLGDIDLGDIDLGDLGGNLGGLVNSMCATLEAGRTTCGMFADSAAQMQMCNDQIDASLKAANCNRRMRRVGHACDRAALLQDFDDAQSAANNAEAAKDQQEWDSNRLDSASSIASAMTVVAVGLASALY
jgi:hypothetical protein